MAFVQHIPVRFDDVDFAQVVFFPKLFRFCHQVFEDFFSKEVGVPYAELLTKRRIGFPTVHSEADFKAPLRFGDVCKVTMEPMSLGQSSITCRYRLHNDKSHKLAAEIELVTVAVALDTFKTVSLPEDVRVAFLNHLHGYHSA